MRTRTTDVAARVAAAGDPQPPGTEGATSIGRRSAHRVRSRLLTGVCWLLALSFLAGAVTKFLPGETFFGPPYSVKFVEWGYPSWFRFVVGSGELLGAVMPVTRRSRFVGAVLLLVILEGAVVTHVVNHHPLARSVAAPVTLALTAAVASASRPMAWRQLLGEQRDTTGTRGERPSSVGAPDRTA